MRFVGVDGEVHVELPDGRTMEYTRFMFLRAWHRHCCNQCPTKKALQAAWEMPISGESKQAEVLEA